MEIIHVLSIGNSFSQDAQRYLHALAKSEGVQIETVNLMIGGCSLSRHYRNMMGDIKAYNLEVNGQNVVGFMTSLKEALTARDWDYITLQQVSKLSCYEESYYPYVEKLADYVRLMCPKAKLLLHQTWGYESNTERICNQGFKSYDEMFAEVKECYNKAAKVIGADGILPSGTAFQYALHHGIVKIHRDTFHASLGVGRFILALVWYRYITGKDISKVVFKAFDAEITEAEYQVALKAAEIATSE